MNKNHHVSNQRKEYTPADDYYTPEWLFKALGVEFDLDVCAPKGGVPWLPAKNHYHLELDGLTQPWFGNIWCNPPYSKPKPWIEKFLDHGQGIALMPYSRSIGFGMLWNNCNGIMNLPNNFKFQHKDHGTKNVFMPVALFAMGNENVTVLKNSGISKVR
jgi:hypothetical protein